MSANCLWCDVGKEGSQTFYFDKALPSVFVLQLSPCYAQQSQHPASSLLGPWRLVS
jgi:hypothetical protein